MVLTMASGKNGNNNDSKSQMDIPSVELGKIDEESDLQSDGKPADAYKKYIEVEPRHTVRVTNEDILQAIIVRGGNLSAQAGDLQAQECSSGIASECSERAPDGITDIRQESQYALRQDGNIPDSIESPNTTNAGRNVGRILRAISRDISETTETDKVPRKTRINKCCHRVCFCFLAKYHVPPQTASRWQNFRYAISCPPHNKMAKLITLVLLALMLWSTLWAAIGDDALPGGNVFAIVILFIASTIGGLLAELCRLPRLLGTLAAGIVLGNVPGIDVGTLAAGIVLGNVPGIDVGKDIGSDWSFAIRKMAVVVVLIRAGIGADPHALNIRKWLVLRLSIFPMVVEGVMVALATRFILDFPWMWSFLQGYVIAPMSAAAAIPFMLQFQASGIGVLKGIPTVVQFGASLDNVLAICIFSVFIGIIFNKDGDMVGTILKGAPLQIVIGIAIGVVTGVILWYIPHRKSKRKKGYRFFFLFGLCLLGAFATGVASFNSAGPLANIVVTLVALYRWRKEGWKGAKNPLVKMFSYVWVVCQILLTGLIGALVDLRSVDWKIMGMGVLILMIGMAFRLLTTFLMVQFSGLSLKEKLFMLICWVPKATVQAAIGSMALDRARSMNLGEEDIKRGKVILQLAVLSILLTAPSAATMITKIGPRLLTKCSEPPKPRSPRIKPKRDATVQIDMLSFDGDKLKYDEVSGRRGSIFSVQDQGRRGSLFNTARRGSLQSISEYVNSLGDSPVRYGRRGRRESGISLSEPDPLTVEMADMIWTYL